MAEIKSFSPGEPLDITNLNAMLQEIKDNRGLLNATKNTVDALNNTKKQTVAKILNGAAPDAAGKTITGTWTLGLTGTFAEKFPDNPSVSITPVYNGDFGIDIRVTKITQTGFTFDARLVPTTTKTGVNVVFYYIAVGQQDV